LPERSPVSRRAVPLPGGQPPRRQRPSPGDQGSSASRRGRRAAGRARSPCHSGEDLSLLRLEILYPRWLRG